MGLVMPGSIRQLGIVDAEIDYQWTRPTEAEFEVPRLYNTISSHYNRCILGLSITFAEWVVWRYSNMAQDPLFLQFIEACWAAVVDRRYLKHKTKLSYHAAKYYKLSAHAQNLLNTASAEERRDPIRGPILVALDWLGEAVDRTTPTTSCSNQAVYLSNLVEQVIGKKNLKGFRNWRRAILAGRFEKLYLAKLEDEDDLGPPLPREFYDAEIEFRPDKADDLIRQFLNGLDCKSNPFLVSPDEMIELGFVGTPYTY